MKSNNINVDLKAFENNNSAGMGTKEAPVSSLELLSKLREGADPKVMIAAQIREYLVSNGGNATSSNLANYFKNKITTADNLVFRSILKKMTDFDKKKKIWKLKTQYL